MPLPRPLVALPLLLMIAGPIGAQRALGVRTPRRTGADSACAYVRCALGIAPAWNGLAVVRGASSERVATLGFFWPRGVLPVFVGQDSAVYYAARAVRVRRTASVLTDGGAVLLVAGMARGIHAGRVERGGRLLAAVGAAAFAVSVPLQFSADRHLSRAVWWHNAAIGR